MTIVYTNFMKYISVVLFVLLIILSLYWLLWGASSLGIVFDMLRGKSEYNLLPYVNRFTILGFSVVKLLTTILVAIFNLGIYGKWLITDKPLFRKRTSIVIAIITLVGLVALGIQEYRISQIAARFEFDFSLLALYSVEYLLIIHYLLRSRKKRM